MSRLKAKLPLGIISHTTTFLDVPHRRRHIVVIKDHVRGGKIVRFSEAVIGSTTFGGLVSSKAAHFCLTLAFVRFERVGLHWR